MKPDRVIYGLLVIIALLVAVNFLQRDQGDTVTTVCQEQLPAGAICQSYSVLPQATAAVTPAPTEAVQ